MTNLYSPNIEIHLTQSVSPDIIKKVKNKEIDIGFIFGKNKSPNIKIKKLANIELCIVGPNNWKEELNSIRSVEELSKYPWIIPPEWCPFSYPLNYFFSQNKIIPTKKIFADTEEMINKLVKMEQGLSVMLKEEAEKIIDNKELLILKDYIFTIDLSIAYLTEKLKNPIIETIYNDIHSVPDPWNHVPSLDPPTLRSWQLPTRVYKSETREGTTYELTMERQVLVVDIQGVYTDGRILPEMDMRRVNDALNPVAPILRRPSRWQQPYLPEEGEPSNAILYKKVGPIAVTLVEYHDGKPNGGQKGEPA